MEPTAAEARTKVAVEPRLTVPDMRATWEAETGAPRRCGDLVRARRSRAGTSDFSSFWVYLVGPTVGALLAVPVYRAVYGDRAPSPFARIL